MKKEHWLVAHNGSDRSNQEAEVKKNKPDKDDNDSKLTGTTLAFAGLLADF